jgi:Na+-driven multidrug efflux pump
MWRYFWLTVADTGALVLVLAVVTHWLVPFFFGVEFSGAIAISRILLLNAFFVSVRRALGEGARGAGQPMASTIGEIATWLSLLPLVYLFAAPWGIEGVGWALVVASIVSLIVTIVAVTGHARRTANVGRPVIQK